MNIPTWLLLIADTLLNRVVALDTHAAERAQKLVGNTIGIDVHGLELQLLLIFRSDGVRVQAAPSDGSIVINTWIRGAPFSLIRARTGDRAPFRDGDVVIEGDMAVGQAAQRWLRELDIDWEEHLSNYLGDPLAHRLASTLRNTTQQARERGVQNAQDATEYLRDEWQLFPFAHETEHLYHEVDRARDDVERLASRIARLEASARGRHT